MKQINTDPENNMKKNTLNSLISENLRAIIKNLDTDQHGWTQI